MYLLCFNLGLKVEKQIKRHNFVKSIMYGGLGLHKQFIIVGFMLCLLLGNLLDVITTDVTVQAFHIHVYFLQSVL